MHDSSKNQALMHDAFLQQVSHKVDMVDYNAALRDYLKFVMDTRNISPTGLAKISGISSTTITRFLNDANHKFILSNKTVDKIAKATNLSPGPFFDIGLNKEKRSIVSGSDRIDSEFVNISEFVVQRGVWHQFGISSGGRIAIGIGIPPIKDNDERFYCTVGSEDLSEFARSGDFLYCERLVAGSRMMSSITPGMIVIVEQKDFEKELTEYSARYVKHKENGDREIDYIIHPSQGHVLRKPIDYPSESDRNVQLLGVVLCIVRTLANARNGFGT